MRSIGKPPAKGAVMQTLRVCTAQRGLRPLDPCVSLRRVYHCEVKALSRSAGRSAAGACAYISGSTARDVYTGAAFDYGRKTRPVEVGFAHTAHLNAAEFSAALDGAENRRNSCVAREVVLALPDSLPSPARVQIVAELADQFAKRWDVPVMWAVHKPDPKGDQRNQHAHFILGTRDSAGKKVRTLDDQKTGKGEVEWLRSAAASQIQAALSVDQRPTWDHRSYQRRGIDGIPCRHEGPFVTAMRRRGVLLDNAKSNDQVRSQVEALEKINEEIYANIRDQGNRSIAAAGAAAEREAEENKREPGEVHQGPHHAPADAHPNQSGPQPAYRGTPSDQERERRSAAVIGGIREVLARIAKAAGNHARNRAESMGRSGGSLACIHPTAAQRHELRGRDSADSRLHAVSKQSGHQPRPQRAHDVQGASRDRCKVQSVADIVKEARDSMEWFASISDMIRAGIERGHIPEGWALAFQRCRTFMDFWQNNVPHPNEWSEQRVKNNNIEFSPHWDVLNRAIEPKPLVVERPARPKNSHDTGGHSHGHGR